MPEILEMLTLSSAEFRGGPLVRHKVNRALWEQAAGDACRGMMTMLSLWADRGAVHMALLNPEMQKIGVISLENRRKGFPSVGKWHPPALRLERAIADLFGFVPEGAPDSRAWLDHGRWGVRHPLGRAQDGGEMPAYAFLPVEGESLHEVPVGPVHAGVIEPGHFRFTAHGETVVRLEERLGYVHKGIDKLLMGASIEQGATLAARTSGDSTVAYGWAYAQAVEAALSVAVPERALWLRALLAELERLANHLGDIGAICNDAAFALMLAHCGVLREKVLRAIDSAFGHRFGRDVIVPGGLARDIGASEIEALRALVADLEKRFPAIVEMYDTTASLLDRTVGTGTLKPELARAFGAGGYVGRASGRNFDTRRDLAYAPYDRISFKVPVRENGDVNQRIWVRILEVQQSFSIVEQCLGRLEPGPVLAELPITKKPTEGLGIVEGFRGDILVWLRLDARGRIARCHVRDPSWFQWPLLEAVIEGNIIADFPLCNKSFNCSYSGHDL